MRALLIAGDKIIQRLKVLQKLQQGYRECGETEPAIHVESLFDVSDLEAMREWEAAKAKALGQQALPMGGVH